METPPAQKPQPEKKKLRMDKIIDATDLEKDKNDIVFEVCEKVNEELSKFPEFVGVFPFGSQTKGYNNETSDVDVYVLYEDTKEELHNALKSIKQQYDKIGITVHVIESQFSKFDISLMKRDHLSLSACLIWRSGRGPKIEFWRNEMRNEMVNLSKEKQSAHIQEVVTYFVNTDEKSFWKMKERMAPFDKKEWLEKRHTMWENQVRSLIFKNEK